MPENQSKDRRLSISFGPLVSMLSCYSPAVLDRLAAQRGAPVYAL
jgi:hypothetical protein